MLFDGKVVIVTGSAGGIGEAAAREFAREGASVVISDVDAERSEGVVKEITGAGGTASFFEADVSDPESVKALIDYAVETYGALDVLVNNAGIGGEQAPVGDLSVEGWKQVIDINLSGVFYGMKYAIPQMLANGGGAIVNVASILGAVGTPGAAAYVSAKHGVIGLTQTAALEYAQQGIRINAVGPGYIRTPLLDPLFEQEGVEDMLVSLHPIGRLGTPEEVAHFITFLASDGASFATGAYYPVDGGYLAQ